MKHAQWLELNRIFERIRKLPDDQFFPLYEKAEKLAGIYHDEMKWIDENIKYQKPIYNPFEIFQPTKALIGEILQGYKREAYRLLGEIQKIKQLGSNGSWLFDDQFGDRDARRYISPVTKHKRLVSRIRQYELYLRGSKQADQKLDVERAKQRPISDFFPTRLRRGGSGRMMGRCPFHNDSSPSFVYYVNQNSWWCYGCSEGGDVVDFVRKLNGLDFVKAVKLILNI